MSDQRCARAPDPSGSHRRRDDATLLAHRSSLIADRCLLPAARRVLERVGDDARLGLVVCGGNATTTDMMAWTDHFSLR